MTKSQETLMQKWAVKTVSDPTVGNLQTPVNSGWFTKNFINNLPVYRAGLSPNFRGLETGAIFGYLLFGPFSMAGPLRNTDFALTAGLLGGVGAIQILTALFILYNAPGKSPNVQPPDSTVANPPADLFTRNGWSLITMKRRDRDLLKIILNQKFSTTTYGDQRTFSIKNKQSKRLKLWTRLLSWLKHLKLGLY